MNLLFSEICEFSVNSWSCSPVLDSGRNQVSEVELNTHSSFIFLSPFCKFRRAEDETTHTQTHDIDHTKLSTLYHTLTLTLTQDRKNCEVMTDKLAFRQLNFKME